MTKNIFTTHLMGGLANQMFQIAHTLAQGWKYGVETQFHPSSFNPNQGNSVNKYIDNIFRKVKFNPWLNPLNFKTCKEKTWNSPDLVFNPKDSIKFEGYFQGSHNFLGFQDEIKKIFGPTEEFKNKIFEKYPNLENENSVSVHIRRGDYLRFNEVFGVIDESYIKHCINLIERPNKVYVFSDDKDWVKNNLSLEDFTLVENLEDYEELWMMSLFKNNIMSCSSFSWWGSYLNNYIDKKVFVPSVWFGPKGPYPYDNIYEKDWNKINVKYTNGKLICY